ncbi:MAG: NusA-like transcription termination signal-binding factor [Candidatus Methanofastidiosia archaeon]
MGVKLGTDEIKYIGLFESMTGAIVKDCMLNEGKITFVVKEGEMGLAIGRKGANILRIKEMIGKGIEIIEYSSDPLTFIKNILKPAQIKSIHISERGNKKVAVLDVLRKDRGLAIGRNGKNIEKVKYLLKRHHDIDDVTIM